MSLLLVDELKLVPSNIYIYIYIWSHIVTHIHDEIEFKDHTKNCTSILFDFTQLSFLFFDWVEPKICGYIRMIMK